MTPATHSRDRRLGPRIDFPVFLNQYVDDRRFRVLASNLSETGVLLGHVTGSRQRRRDIFGLEIELPEVAETIWLRAERCREIVGEMVSRSAVRFTGLARSDARLLRDYCVEARRAQLHAMLRRIRRQDAVSRTAS